MVSFVYQATFLCLIDVLVEVGSQARPTATIVCIETGVLPTITQDVANEAIRLYLKIWIGGTGFQNSEEILTQNIF